MTEATPLQTALPGMVALGVMALGAVRGRRVLWEGLRRVGWLGLAWFVGAVLVRLLVLPALGQHQYDGHEAEYFDLFVGERALSRGGPVLYPAMQWFWAGLGVVLPHSRAVPVLVSTLIATAGVGMLASALGLLSDRRVGWVVAAVLALHPAHAAWSSSAYNVGLPFALGALATLSGALALRGPRLAPGVAWMGAGAGALAVATRIDSAPWGLLVVVLALVAGLARGGPGPRRLLALLPAALVGVVLAVAAAWPILFPGELPGEGERAMAFAMNSTWLDPLAPFDHPVVMGAWVLGCGATMQRWPGLGLVALLWPVAVHLGFATFDDYGDRHALLALPGLAGGVGLGVMSLGRHRLGRPVAAVLLATVLVAELLGLADLRARYYGSEEAHSAVLAASPYASLPRWTAEQAREDCGWVAEDPRVSREPVASHFNLLDPLEAEALRAGGGCLRWCADVQDWRWSSRGVRDRALRVSRLYMMQAVAVVEEPVSGYSCLVMQVGARRCCHVGRSGPVDPAELSSEDHVPTAPGAPGIP